MSRTGIGNGKKPATIPALRLWRRWCHWPGPMRIPHSRKMYIETSAARIKPMRHNRENYARQDLRGGKTGTARQVAWLFSPVD
jgi:hypothetical protein